MLDADQSVAYQADANVVVAAGAGSGKTTVLSERYVRLVTERGFDVSEVLTLTFTRKAQAEMYNRIFQKLRRSSHPRAPECVEHFDQARIATLDSFCTAIVRGGVSIFGLSNDFRIDPKELQSRAVESAIELVMQHRQEPVIRNLVASRSFNAVVNDLFADLALESFSLVHPGNFEKRTHEQIRFLEKETKNMMESINATGDFLFSVDDSKCKSKTPQNIKEVLAHILPLHCDFSGESLQKLAQKADYVRSGKSFSNIKSNVKDPVLIEFRDPVTKLKGKAETLLAIIGTFQFRDYIESLGRLFDAYEAHFLEKKRQQGILSFKDVAELSVEILKNDLDLRNFYKTGIKAIMIDEFQDNNSLQKDLLYLLAEKDDSGAAGLMPTVHDLNPEKLFFVGDEKQSIYKFRGADVSVFRTLSGELGGEPVALRTNYRSTANLVTFYNSLFPGVFRYAEQIYEAEFSPMQSPPGKTIETDPAVEIHLQLSSQQQPDFSEGDEDSGELVLENGEALAAGERILAGVRNHEFSFGDVAFLFRSTSHQNQYERIFRRLGIPFTATDPRGLFFEGPANDFYALLRLSLFPHDRNAYATVLRSPFVQVSDSSVFRILLENPAPVFPADAPEEWFDNAAERARYVHGCEVFAEVQHRLDAQSLGMLFSYLWYESGYQTLLMYDPALRHNTGHFDYLYTLALDADSRHLNAAAFLDELAPFMKTNEKVEADSEPAQSDIVRFLTVHKSKGLEFPVVVLANSGSKVQKEKNDKPYYLDPVYGPTVNFRNDSDKHNEQIHNYFFDINKEEADKQTIAELKRLFYVAATRAEKKLFIFGTLNLLKAEKDAIEGMSEDEALDALISQPRRGTDGEIRQDSFLDLLALGLSRAEDINSHYRLIPFSTPPEKILNAHIHTLRNTESESSVQMSNPELFYESESIPPHFTWTSASPSAFDTDFYPAGGIELQSLPVDELLSDGACQAAFGTICHTLIKDALDAQHGAVRLSSESENREMEKAFRDVSLTKGEVSHIIESARHLADLFMASRIAQEACTADRIRTEFPFVLPWDLPDSSRIMLDGRIDLIYEYAGQCIVVDFKTDRLFHAGAHRQQMEWYRHAAHAFSDLPVKSVVVYLRNLQEDWN
ncbi:ATPase AAA [Spirochaetia bacterium]|nr:ATPase AAA [Spirochaetia bacterium]